PAPARLARPRRPPRGSGRGAGLMSMPLPDVVLDSARRYRVLRLWPRGRTHALAELAAEDGATVAAQWFAERSELAAAAARAPSPARAAGDVLLQPGGADARLRALPDVLAEDGARL